MSILRLTPAFKDYLWGGQKLRGEYGVTELDRVSEAWVLSCHKDGESRVVGGEYDGMALSAVLEQLPNAVGAAAKRFDRFPILIKFIDAAQNLSVQVPPSDEYALRVEKEYGKTEMWYILDAEPGAGIYYGFKNEVSKQEFEDAIRQNTLTDLLEFVEVKAGECYFIPAGTIHAIGAGLLIAEIQQNSNTTYRVYDYGRVGADGKPRDLHVEKALDVTALCPAPVQGVPTQEDGMTVLSECEYFRTLKLELDGTKEITVGDSFLSVLVVDGAGKINGEEFSKNDSFFVTADTDAVMLEGKATVLLSSVK